MIVKTFSQVVYGLATVALLATFAVGVFFLTSRTAPQTTQPVASAADVADDVAAPADHEGVVAVDTTAEDLPPAVEAENVPIDDNTLLLETGEAVSITSFDQLSLKGSFYPAITAAPAPGVILVHGPGQDRAVWNDMVLHLHDRGYAVLTIDGRGFGETGGVPLVQKMPEDVLSVWHNFSDRPEVDAEQTFIIGVGQSADKIFEAGTKLPEVQGMVLISPSYAIAEQYDFFKKLSFIFEILVIAAEDDTPRVGAGEALVATSPAAALQTFAGDEYGMSILQQQPESREAIVSWLDQQVSGD